MDNEKIREIYKNEVGLPITCIDAYEIGFRGKYVEWLENELVKKLTIPVVSYRRELLTFLEEVASDNRMMSDSGIRSMAKELMKVNCS